MRLEWWAEHRPIFKNNENAHHLHVSFTPETGTELPKTGVSFLLGWVDVAFSRDGRPRETNAPSPPNRLRRGRFDWINRRPNTELKYTVVSKRVKRETYSDSEKTCPIKRSLEAVDTQQKTRSPPKELRFYYWIVPIGVPISWWFTRFFIFKGDRAIAFNCSKSFRRKRFSQQWAPWKSSTKTPPLLR